MALPKYKPGTTPFDHQADNFRQARDRAAFAHLSEQGTGKTKVIIDEAADLYERDRIDVLVVVGPNEGDVPDNWVDQCAIHMPKRIKYTALRMYSNPLAKQRDELERLLSPTWHRDRNGLRVLTTNIEALRANSNLFRKLLKLFRALNGRVLLAMDESTRIKSHTAAQTRAMYKLGANVDFRRISTGTLSPNGPLDVYAQFQFLDADILGFDSFTAYKAHFCQLLPPGSGIVRHTASKMASRIRDPLKRAEFEKKMISIIQIPARDPAGQIIYRNEDQLAKLIKPHSFRVLKADCLDLPPKVYAPARNVELTDKQREIYDEVRKNVIAEFVKDQELHQMTVSLAIVRLLRLQQVVCNHFSPDPNPDEPKQPPRRIEVATRDKKGKLVVRNPRMLDLLAWIEEADHKAKGIIYCRHHPEIAEIVETLTELYGHQRVGQIHGKVPDGLRVTARKNFQDPKHPLQWLVMQVRSGIGIDLFEASWEYYYSNDYSLENRLQSEDRGHRQGLKHSLTIADARARNTLDIKIVETLRMKKEISDIILGDNPINWI